MRRINNFWFEYTFTANKLKYQIILIKSHIIYDIPEFFKLKNRPFCQNNHPSKSLPTFRSLLRHCLYHPIITTNIIDVVFHIFNLLRRRQGNVHDKIVENMSIMKRHIDQFIQKHFIHIFLRKRKQPLKTILMID